MAVKAVFFFMGLLFRCRICQNVIKANYITIMKHLKCVHNVTFKDYKKKFGIFIGKVRLQNTKVVIIFIDLICCKVVDMYINMYSYKVIMLRVFS